MAITIRNIDETVYRALKAKAALTGKTVEEVVNEAIRAYLARPNAHARRGSLRELKPENYPKGNERLSEKIDIVLYGA
jgi:plasmid stability protein